MLSIEASSRDEFSASDIIENNRDPLLDFIVAYRKGLADFVSNAPEDNDGNKAYAEVSFRLPRKTLESWSSPATTFAGAISALKMAVDADKNDDVEIVSSMIRAAWGYFETKC